MEPVLLVAKEDGVTTLTLNRPDSLNALSSELRGALVEAFEAADRDPEASAIILTGGGRAFCAGVDLKELGGEIDGSDEPLDIDVVGAMRACGPAVIGAINGVAVTGGFEIALACDFLVASTDARFADTHARVGLLPGWGLSQRLPRLIGLARAKELSLTGNFVDAETAERWGVVNRVVPPEELLPVCRRLAADVASCHRETLLALKGLMDAGYEGTFAHGLALETRTAEAYKRSVSPEAIAERRRAIQARGRGQAG